jgi:acetyltransferase
MSTFTTAATDERSVQSTLERRHHGLQAMFNPRAVALIGATERLASVGRSLMENLLHFPGELYPINPGRSSVLGRDAFPHVGAIPSPADLAIIAIPAIMVRGAVRQCAAAGVPSAVIISAGFRECGPVGAALEHAVLDEARDGNVRILGPNCMGLAVPAHGLNATFGGCGPLPGRVAFISQSGALGAAVLDWSVEQNIGFSAFVSVGSMADVGWGELLNHFGDDTATKAIALYIESVDDPRAFLSAAREVALTKPIVVLKAGRTLQAGRAAASHTGRMTGSDDVFDAALRRVGVLRVDSIGQLFDMVETLSSQPAARGPRLAVVTNAGGPGVLATDALVGAGGKLAELSKTTIDRLDRVLPEAWSRANPVDVLGDATPETFAEALDAVAQDDACDGVLAILTPQGMSEPSQTASRVAQAAGRVGKPVLASWMGGRTVEAGRSALRAAGVPIFRYPDDAARAFEFMWRHAAALRSLYETPELGSDTDDKSAADIAQVTVAAVIHAADRVGRTILTEHDTKQILSAYGIPCAKTAIALGADEAVREATNIGYPVALKLHSTRITHKSDAGGVKLNLHGERAVRAAYHAIEVCARRAAGDGGAEKELVGVTVQPMVDTAGGCEVILGSSTDAQFGPVLLFGLGGRLVEVLRDRAFALPPLTTTLVRHLMEQTKAYAALQGIRGEPAADLAALEQLIVRFSRLIVEHPRIREIEINPLFVRGSLQVALDARATLHDRNVHDDELPRPAIRPYPRQYMMPWTLRDGTAVTIRPIRPEDEPLMVRFHAGLSEEAVHRRYGGLLKLSARVAHERLIRMCFVDYDRQIALVADRVNESGEHELLGIARLIRSRAGDEAEFAIVITDRWQRHGLGTKLLDLVIRIARAEGVRRLTATVMPESNAMLSLCRRAGFNLRQPTVGGEWRAVMAL